MKKISKKQFNRLTNLQKVEEVERIYRDKFNNLSHDYNTYQINTESVDIIDRNRLHFEKQLAQHINETLDILSQFEEEFLYYLTQHFGALDSDFKNKIDELCPSDGDNYWIGGPLTDQEYNDIDQALNLVKVLRKEAVSLDFSLIQVK